MIRHDLGNGGFEAYWDDWGFLTDGQCFWELQWRPSPGKNLALRVAYRPHPDAGKPDVYAHPQSRFISLSGIWGGKPISERIDLR